MKIIVNIVALCLLITTAFKVSAQPIVIGKIDTVYSNILNEKRAVYIYVPATDDKAQRFPVLYLLDGEDHFESAVAIAKQLSGPLPDMVIVGITNTVRERDLTPTHVEASAKESGGGGQFLQFMQQELMPYINKTYPAAPYKLFSGHSLGGLAVINAFLNHTNMFDAYIALDPSLWWDDKKFLKQAQAQLPAMTFSNKTLYLGFANNMRPGVDTAQVQKDTLDGRTLVTRSVIPFLHVLNGLSKSNGLTWNAKYISTERHGTVELLGEYDALRTVFNYYQFNVRQFDDNPSLNIDSLVVAHYAMLSKKLGYTMLPTEDLINNLGYTCMSVNKMDKAYVFFKMNIDNHPNSANAYDSIGEYYENVGNKAKAIESYEKSLSLHETADTRRKLKSLKGK